MSSPPAMRTASSFWCASMTARRFWRRGPAPRRSPRWPGAQRVRCWPTAPRTAKRRSLTSAEAANNERSGHQHVLELPGVAVVDLLREQLVAPAERRPVGVGADHRAEIGTLDFEAAAKIHLVGFDNAALGVLQQPHDAGEHRRGHLQPGGVLVGREQAGFLDREL